MARDRKPNLKAEAAYENAHLVAQDLVERVKELLFDMPAPGDDEHLFHWHQDFTYLLGSPNAVTIWIPLTEANETRGSVEIVPHSHRQGVLPVAPLTARHARSDCASGNESCTARDPRLRP